MKKQREITTVVLEVEDAIWKKVKAMAKKEKIPTAEFINLMIEAYVLYEEKPDKSFRSIAVTGSKTPQ